MSEELERKTNGGERNMRKSAILLISVLVLASFFGGIACSSGEEAAEQTTQGKRDYPMYQDVLIGDISVAAGGYYSVEFSADIVNQPGVSLVGSFVASGGSGSGIGINVLLLKRTQYINWANGVPFTATYEAGQQTMNDLNWFIWDSGRYHLVFSNLFDTKSAKSVNANFHIEWTEWR
jgi:hypothetical protein